MDKDEFSQFLGSLRSLTRAQAEEARTKLGYQILRGTASGYSRPVAEAEDWLLTGILHTLVQNGHMHPDRARSFKIKPDGGSWSFNQTSKEQRMLIEEAAPGLDLQQLRLLGYIVGKALFDLVAFSSHDTPLNNCLRYVGRTTQAVEKAFPGYIAAGMLGVVIKWS